MKILIALTYYRPHISGLTIYAERLAKAFAHRGHQVTVLTSQYQKHLPKNEIVDGVEVVRVPVWFRLSKGVIMPSIGWIATRLIREADAVQLHLPQFDAAGLALRGRLFKKPTLLTYHCDLELPPGLFNRLANLAVHFMNNLAARFAHGIITYTQDYADHSPFLTQFLNKVHIISPPVELLLANPGEIEAFQLKNNPKKQYPVIGMAARFASEKGVEVLLKALPIILQAFPHALVLFARPTVKVMGEEPYFEKLKSSIEQFTLHGHWTFLDGLTPEQMASYYPNIDVFVVPSLNSTESFGLVQIEAMMNGIPVVSADLPGVRQPVKVHQMGEVTPVGDPESLADAVIRVFKDKNRKSIGRGEIERIYRPDTIAAEYEKLFMEIKGSI